MRDYELTILLKADKDVKSLTALVEKAGAKEIKKTDAEKRPLAYEIAKVKEAFYIFFEFKLEGDKVSQLENQLRLQDNIIRYLLVRKGE